MKGYQFAQHNHNSNSIASLFPSPALNSSTSLKLICRQKGASNQEYSSYPCIVEVTDHTIIGYDEKKENHLWGIEFQPDVLMKVEWTSGSDQKNEQNIKEIGLLNEKTNEQFIFQVLDGESLEDLYMELTRKPIFEWNFKGHYKPRQKKYATEDYTYYTAFSRKTKEQALVKAIQIVNFAKEQFKQSFLNEFYSLKQLDSPHLLKLFHSYKSQNTVYMVYENMYASLTQFISFHGFPSFVGKKIIIKTILSALKYLHSKGFSHGTINMQTILVQLNNQNDQYCVKLGHFNRISALRQNGYAKQFQDIESAISVFNCLLCEQFVYDPSNVEFSVQNAEIEKLLQMKDLFERMVMKDEKKRISVGEALEHDCWEDAKGFVIEVPQ